MIKNAVEKIAGWGEALAENIKLYDGNVDGEM